MDEKFIPCFKIALGEEFSGQRTLRTKNFPVKNCSGGNFPANKCPRAKNFLLSNEKLSG
jgi:hypothetical protein